MKKLLLISLLLFSAMQLSAQAPQQFSFQGVARDAAGKTIANTSIGLRLTIHQTTAIGNVLYREAHKPTTSQGGIFNVFVGGGIAETGLFKDINWASGVFFMQIEIDPAGGTNYTDLGATQLLSVPYALHAGQADKWKDGDPVVQSGKEGQGGMLPDFAAGSPNTNLIWYPRKSAFRAGYATGTWNDSNIGLSSAAFGIETTASGEGSFAAGWGAIASGVVSVSFGKDTKATGIGSTASGFETTASGDFATAFGASSQATGANSTALGSSSANGNNSVSSGSTSIANGNSSVAMGEGSESAGNASFAMGFQTKSKAAGSFSIGSFNDQSDNPSQQTFQDFDRIFQIGNGTAANSRSNVLTILRNGYVGIGEKALTPKFILDIAERPRIRHNTNSSNGNSAGMFFDDSNGNPNGFVGMKTNAEIGFYNADKWLFWMDNLGNAHIIGSNYNTSDRRLKRDFSSLSSSLGKLSDLNGYHYFWKDSTLDQTLQTGLIAQEVEIHFPELVKTDDKGFKSVNYTGLIPHLIESVKELRASVEYLQNLNTAIKIQNEKLKVQTAEIEGLRKDLDTLLNAAKSPLDVSQSSVKSDTNSFKSNRVDK